MYEYRRKVQPHLHINLLNILSLNYVLQREENFQHHIRVVIFGKIKIALLRTILT